MRSRITWVALISVLFVAAQILLGSHVHIDDDHHSDHEEPPQHECSICLINTATDDAVGPTPDPVDFPVLAFQAEQRPAFARTFDFRHSKYAGASPRGPPLEVSCVV